MNSVMSIMNITPMSGYVEYKNGANLYPVPRLVLPEEELKKEKQAAQDKS